MSWEDLIYFLLAVYIVAALCTLYATAMATNNYHKRSLPGSFDSVREARLRRGENLGHYVASIGLVLMTVIVIATSVILWLVLFPHVVWITYGVWGGAVVFWLFVLRYARIAQQRRAFLRPIAWPHDPFRKSHTA